MQGKLIALEGIDGSGTTTQTRALADALAKRGHRVRPTCEPTETSTGKALREMLHAPAESVSPESMALLFAADRAQHVHEVIRPAVENGEVVICDRYIASSWVYQGMRVPPTWVLSLARGCPWPDITFVLSVSPEHGMDRLMQRGRPLDVFERLDVQRYAATRYDEYVLTCFPGTKVVDGTGTPEQVTARLLSACVDAGL